MMIRVIAAAGTSASAHEAALNKYGNKPKLVSADDVMQKLEVGDTFLLSRNVTGVYSPPNMEATYW